jgi:hypothetical protein
MLHIALHSEEFLSELVDPRGSIISKAMVLQSTVTMQGCSHLRVETFETRVTTDIVMHRIQQCLVFEEYLRTVAQLSAKRCLSMHN